MQIEKLMSHQVITCASRDSLQHAASLMWNSDCGGLPVAGGGALVGIVSMAGICTPAVEHAA